MLENLWSNRAISYQTIFETGDDIAIGGLAGTNVTDKSVFQINAVYRAVSLIADTISTLPIDAYITRDGSEDCDVYQRNGQGDYVRAGRSRVHSV